MKRIGISSLSGTSRVSREDGRQLREGIELQWLTEDVIELDFENIRIASVSFLDEGIAILALRHTLDEIRRKLRFVNMKDLDRRLVEQLLEARSRERSDSATSKQ